MVIESTSELRNRMVALLIEKGQQAEGFGVSQDAIDALSQAPKNSCSLIISSYMMPKMKGDAILQKAKEISPDSQRLLLADTADLETLVSAINEAGIHACLTLPFSDEDFLIQASQCCHHYDENLKLKNLNRVTKRQNKQLFEIASNFKKKSDHYSSQLKAKDQEIRVLESRIKSAGGTVDDGSDIPIIDLLTQKKVTLTPENLGSQFQKFKTHLFQVFESFASANELKLQPISYAEAQTFAMIPNANKEFVQQLWPQLTKLLKEGPKTTPQGDSNIPVSSAVTEIDLDEYFSISLKKNDTQAFIRVKKSNTDDLTPEHVRQFLEKNKIINGVKNNSDIQTWLNNARPEDEAAFLVAQGRDAVPPKHAQIRYHFETDYLHAGKINEDGSIDFQDRGEIPYVEENAFLAAKIFAEEGTPGINVLGKEIEVEDAEDITFSAGPGTRISEDGVRIYATVSGQPHLDAMGNISVCPEYQLKGDIGFETGDVDFDGNVIVQGAVKQGFKVKCASLTAKEIQGAEIDIAGDLNVSDGIVDTELVKVKGNVQAKFVRNSKINAFGDLIIQKEIVDSKIFLSGACINKTGAIIHSEISAKMGIDAGSIGNKSAKPSILTVGVDENTNQLVSKVDSKLHVNNTAINELAEEIKGLEKEDMDLHAVISKYAYTQDRSQLELKDIEKKMADLKASGNMSAFQKISRTVKDIQKKATEAETKINDGFKRQDEIEMDISQKKKRIKELLDDNKIHEDEKKRLMEFSKRDKPLPEIKVSGRIESGTKCFAENSSLTLHKSSSHCKIKEIGKSNSGVGDIMFYDMEIVNY